LVGFDGIMYDAHDFSEVDWYPSELRIGRGAGEDFTDFRISALKK
jgi:hypothetical protein